MYSTRNPLISIAVLILYAMTASNCVADELADKLKSLEEKDAFSGTVLLAQGDEVIFSTAIGLASRRYDVKNKLDTKFNIASMNKMFTAVAILQLVQEGSIKLDDTIDSFVDESWLPSKISSKITVAHLLAHKSGLGDIFVDAFWEKSRLKFRDLADYKPLVVSSELENQPGKQKSYSNVGFLLLGVVIEKASGLAYDDYIMQNVCKPAGMTNTACYAIDKPVPNLAIGYFRKEGEKDWTENTLIHTVKGGPAGGGYSTVEDLFRFSRALTGHKLLDREHTERLLAPNSELGFENEPTPIGRVSGHSGGFFGIMCKLEIHANKDVTAIILSNMDNAGIPVLRAVHAKIRTLK